MTRMDNRDLEQVALVALLQREAGGNAAEVLDQVAENVRARLELRRLVRTLTAQGRMARWIVTAAARSRSSLGIFMLNPDYWSRSGTTRSASSALVARDHHGHAGSLIIKRIVDIKV